MKRDHRSSILKLTRHTLRLLSVDRLTNVAGGSLQHQPDDGTGNTGSRHHNCTYDHVEGNTAIITLE